MNKVTNLIQLAGWIIGGIIIAGIILVVLEANEDNAIVDVILEIGRFFTRPFRDIFEMDDNKLEIAVNWGIGAVVWILLGILISTLVHAILRRGGRTAR